MKNGKPLSARVKHDQIFEAAGPRRPPRKPPAKPLLPSSPAKPAGENKPAQPSPPPKKPAGK